MSIVTVTFKKLFAVVLGILGVFKSLYRKFVCRSRSGRRMSGSVLPLTTEHHIQDLGEIQQSLPGNEVEFEAWDSWGTDGLGAPNGPQSNNSYHGNSKQTGSHGNSVYRSISQDSEEPEPEIDYFQDMTPHLKRPKKVIIKRREDHHRSTGGFSNRLGVSSDLPPQDGELGAWEESETNAWGEESLEDLAWEAESAIKEKRRSDREQRHLEQQRKKMEKEANRGARKDTQFSAVKLS